MVKPQCGFCHSIFSWKPRDEKILSQLNALGNMTFAAQVSGWLSAKSHFHKYHNMRDKMISQFAVNVGKPGERNLKMPCLCQNSKAYISW